MSYQYLERTYPDRTITWPDGSTLPTELSSLLLDTLQPGFEIQGGQFSWNANNWLAMTLRVSVLRPRQKSRTWEVRLSCPAQDAAAVRPEGTTAEREWFTARIRTHLSDWLNGQPSIIESARLIPPADGPGSGAGFSRP